jgi:hypothetical protein
VHGVVEALEARARFANEGSTTYVRVGTLPGEPETSFYLDLADRAGTAVA